MEEQFYLVWPALLLVLVPGRRGAAALPRRLVLGVLLVVTGASFVWSVVSTSSDPLAAYFSTPARAWELGLGRADRAGGDRRGRRGCPRSCAGWSAAPAWR